jgi:hypothetical protein
MAIWNFRKENTRQVFNCRPTDTGKSKMVWYGMTASPPPVAQIDVRIHGHRKAIVYGSPLIDTYIRCTTNIFLSVMRFEQQPATNLMDGQTEQGFWLPMLTMVELSRLRKNSVGLSGSSGLSGLFCCSTQETK